MPKKRSSRDERKLRRKAIAIFCKRNTMAEAAKKYACSIAQVHLACKEFGVEPMTPEHRLSQMKLLRIASAILEGGKTGHTPRLARRFRTSEVTINRIKRQMRGLKGFGYR